MHGNGSIVGRYLIAHRSEELVAFDQLPRAVRDAMNYAVFKYNAAFLLSQLRQGRSVDWIVSGIAASDKRKLGMLGNKHG